MKGYCYVYYKDPIKSEHGFKEYAHPEIRIYELRDDAQGIPELGDCVLTISAQIDSEQYRPYGYRISVGAEKLRAAKKFISGIEKESPGFMNYRAIIRAIQKKKLVRYICIRWPEVKCQNPMRSGGTDWVPYRFRHNADLYFQAMKAGMKAKR